MVRSEIQQGKGNVIRRMFREVNAESYIMLDGDDTYPAEDIPGMVDLIINQKVDMVVGDRLSSTYFEENKRPFHNFGNRIVRWSINHFFNNEIRDIMTGYRAFSFNFVKTFPVLSTGFEIETEMSITAAINHMHVKNYLITYRDRPEGSSSKLNTFSDGMKVLKTIASMFRNYHPQLFYSLISLIFLIVAAAFFFPVVWVPYLETGDVNNFPTLIVCGFLVMAAIISLYSGFILHSLVKQEKRDFEFHLQEVQFEHEHLQK
ncbi:family 2 glycosyltransferase [Lactiplantibacillus fabifermentans DSM 21115]|uniref:Family 2 glycosyltransferase n=1 Tax=Lactiplantibacillus fabifermentans DSM 21115 TaxID=1413187 RepID=A0A0R2NPK9_9LACO|nr:family 2 glycosyltransferase [Lactiplantibacillus fabifermentans DSM 21115]